jgi:hypothetical protein
MYTVKGDGNATVQVTLSGVFSRFALIITTGTAEH